MGVPSNSIEVLGQRQLGERKPEPPRSFSEAFSPSFTSWRGRPYTMTPAKLRLAHAAMSKRDTKVGELCKELGVTRQTLYRFVDPKGELRAECAIAQA
jgi:hypothetical protein